MSHPPDPRAHDTHPRELIAAHAAGDAGGADLATATALVARCPACAELHRDLRAIAAALPATAVPPRTRDHRLDPARAARLRPAGWRGLIAPLGGRRFTFLAPMGATLATLGLAGLLVATLPAIPLGGAGTGQMAGAPREEAGEAPPSPAATAAEPRVRALDNRASATPAIEHQPDAAAPRTASDEGSSRTVGGPAGSGILAAGALLAVILGIGLLGLRLAASRAAAGR